MKCRALNCNVVDFFNTEKETDIHVGCVIKNVCMYRAPEAQKMDIVNTFLFDSFSREINGKTRTPRDVGWVLPTAYALTVGIVKLLK